MRKGCEDMKISALIGGGCLILLGVLLLGCCCPTAMPVVPPDIFNQDTSFNGTNSSTSIDITEPTSGTTTDESSITVRGTTTPGAILTVNDKTVNVSPDGSFSTTVALYSGENTIVLVAKKGSTEPAIEEITVTSATTST